MSSVITFDARESLSEAPPEIAGTLYASPAFEGATMLYRQKDRHWSSYIATDFHTLKDGDLFFDTPWKAYRVSWEGRS